MIHDRDRRAPLPRVWRTSRESRPGSLGLTPVAVQPSLHEPVEGPRLRCRADRVGGAREPVRHATPWPFWKRARQIDRGGISIATVFHWPPAAGA
jgi:hypothetical protein